jgi:ribosomal-protein-alanine N-acetyltransferase
MILIREFSPTDIASVREVAKYSLGESYPPSLYLTIHNLWPSGFLVAREDGKVVAFLAAIVSGPRAARVLMLAVLPQHRRRSFGRLLMREFYSRCIAKSLDSVTLEVRKSNRNAIAFYGREGFTRIGELNNFYSNGEDAYQLMKTLQT